MDEPGKPPSSADYLVSTVLCGLVKTCQRESQDSEIFDNKCMSSYTMCGRLCGFSFVVQLLIGAAAVQGEIWSNYWNKLGSKQNDLGGYYDSLVYSHINYRVFQKEWHFLDDN